MCSGTPIDDTVTQKEKMAQTSLEVVLPKGQQEQFLSVLRPLLGPTSCEAGCTHCSVWRSITDERHFRFLTEWESVSDLDRYLGSARFREVLVAAELSNEKPRIIINTISETHGLEYITDLLRSAERAGG